MCSSRFQRKLIHAFHFQSELGTGRLGQESGLSKSPVMMRTSDPRCHAVRCKARASLSPGESKHSVTTSGLGVVTAPLPSETALSGTRGRDSKIFFPFLVNWNSAIKDVRIYGLCPPHHLEKGTIIFWRVWVQFRVSISMVHSMKNAICICIIFVVSTYSTQSVSSSNVDHICP